MGAPLAPQMYGGSTTLYYRNVRRNGFYLQDLAQLEKDGCLPTPRFIRIYVRYSTHQLKP